MRLGFNALPGDVVFVESGGVIGFGIRSITQRRGEGRTYVNHVSVIVPPLQEKAEPASAVMLVDAQPPDVERRPLAAYVGDLVAVYRHAGLTYAQRLAIAEKARTYEGDRYGKTKILLHAFGMQALCVWDDRPICSYEVAMSYAHVLPDIRFGSRFDVKPNAADPDDIWDAARAGMPWVCMRRLSILEAA